jgi:hypothetical protein
VGSLAKIETARTLPSWERRSPDRRGLDVSLKELGELVEAEGE